MAKPFVSADEHSRLQALHRLNVLDTPVESFFQRLVRLTQQLFDVPIAAISLIDEKRQWFKAVQGLDFRECPRQFSFCNHTIANSKLLVVNKAHLDARFKTMHLVQKPPRVCFYAGFPIQAPNGKNIGAICIMHTTKSHQVNQKKLFLLQDLAKIVEQELAKYQESHLDVRLLSHLEPKGRVALLDASTQLWNHKAMQRLLAYEVAEAKHAHRQLGIAIVDIDRLQAIKKGSFNQRKSFLLHEVAQCIIESCAANDRVGYWENGQYMIIFRHKALTQMKKCAETIRQAIYHYKFQQGQWVIPITTSIGIAVLAPKAHCSVAALIKSANDSVYLSKQLGRNRIEWTHAAASSRASV